MLCLILRDQRNELFSYGDLVRPRLDAPASRVAARTLSLRFIRARVTDVVLEGRWLIELVHNLRRHRILWLRETPTDRTFLDGKAIAITRITISPAEGQW